MADALHSLLMAGPAGEPPLYGNFLVIGLIFAIFYFLVIVPEKGKRRKVEEMIKGLKSGDRVIVNPGIFATIVAVEEDAFQVRIDDKTKMKVLKSAVSALQGPPPQTEKK
jgi:preprotein translocase subunit YajC